MNIYPDYSMSEQSKTIYSIVHLIKCKNDYEQAAKIMMDNSISLGLLFSLTCKLTQLQFATLADKLVIHR